MVNIELLKEKIRIKGYGPNSLAKKIGVDASTIYRRYANNGADFTIEEVQAIADALDLTNVEFNNIFFPHRVA